MNRYEKDRRVWLRNGTGVEGATIWHYVEEPKLYCLWIDNWGEEWLPEKYIIRYIEPDENDPHKDWR